MSIVEINNITNEGGSQNNSSWYGLIGVALGFLLNQLATEINKIRERNKVGKTFQIALESYKEPIKKQVQAIVNYKAQVADYLLRPYPNLILLHKFDSIAILDKLTLVKFFKKEKKDQSFEFVNNIYNNLEYIKDEINGLVKLANDYDKLKKELLMEYKVLQDNTVMAIAQYGEKHTPEQLRKNDVFVLFENIYKTEIKPYELNPQKFIAAEDKVHMVFTRHDIPVGHDLYKIIVDFNFKGLDLIYRFKGETGLILKSLEEIESSIKEKYRNIYNIDFAF